MAGITEASRRMKPIRAAFLGLSLAGVAHAQNGAIQSTPLPPLQQQWQQEGSPPVQQAPDGEAAPNAPGLPAPDQPIAPPVPIQRPSVWVPASTVKLDALDKVNAQATALTIKVGQRLITSSMRASGGRTTRGAKQ